MTLHGVSGSRSNTTCGHQDAAVPVMAQLVVRKMDSNSSHPLLPSPPNKPLPTDHNPLYQTSAHQASAHQASAHQASTHQGSSFVYVYFINGSTDVVLKLSCCNGYRVQGCMSAWEAWKPSSYVLGHELLLLSCCTRLRSNITLFVVVG